MRHLSIQMDQTVYVITKLLLHLLEFSMNSKAIGVGERDFFGFFKTLFTTHHLNFHKRYFSWNKLITCEQVRWDKQKCFSSNIRTWMQSKQTDAIKNILFWPKTETTKDETQIVMQYKSIFNVSSFYFATPNCKSSIEIALQWKQMVQKKAQFIFC